MRSNQAIEKAFPGAMPEDRFVSASLQAAASLGFEPSNSLPCVGTCRDEICQPFTARVHEAWGSPFLMGALAGMLFLGRTGLQAAHSHAPVHEERERYVYMAMTHIGMGAAGEPGHCARPTRPGDVSAACGALLALLGQIQQGRISEDAALDTTEIEMTLVARRLLAGNSPGADIDLVGLTKLACAAIGDDLESAIRATVDPERADYCVFTGVQVHTPDGGTLIWPDRTYAIVEGEQHELEMISKASR